MNIQTITVTDSIDMNENYMNLYTMYFIDASNNNIEIQITNDPVTQGLVYEFLRIDNNTSNTVTFIAKSGYTVSGSTSLSLDINQHVTLINNGSDWIAPRYTYN